MRPAQMHSYWFCLRAKYAILKVGIYLALTGPRGTYVCSTGSENAEYRVIVTQANKIGRNKLPTEFESHIRERLSR